MPSTPAKTAAAKQLGSLVQTARRKCGLTGTQLGEKVGLSQSKISKFEHGQPPLPSPQTIESILDILIASKKIRQQAQLLIAQVRHVNSTTATYSSVVATGRYLKAESKASTVQVYSHNVVPALLQTSDYRKASLKMIGIHDHELAATMKESVLRQDLLWDTNISYVLLIQEAALYTAVSGPMVQLTQLDRLERFIGQQTCQIGVVPTTAGLPILEVPNFVMYDTRQLLYSVGTTEIESNEPEMLTQFIQAFAELHQKSYFGHEAIEVVRKAIDHFASGQVDRLIFRG